MKKITALIGSIAIVASSATTAGIISTFNDKTSFLSTTGASSVTGPIPDMGGVGTTATLGDVTFSTTAFPTSSTIVFGGNNWSTLIPGNEIAISGTENLDISINLLSDVFSFGFDFHEPTSINQLTDGTNTPYSHESIFTIELFDGVTLVDTASFDPLSDQLEFFGLASDMGFNSVRITENLAGFIGSQGVDISNDNEFFGEFYASSSVSVPEPSIAALFGAGLIGLGLARRKALALHHRTS